MVELLAETIMSGGRRKPETLAKALRHLPPPGPISIKPAAGQQSQTFILDRDKQRVPQLEIDIDEHLRHDGDASVMAFDNVLFGATHLPPCLEGLPVEIECEGIDGSVRKTLRHGDFHKFRLQTPPTGNCTCLRSAD